MVSMLVDRRVPNYFTGLFDPDAFGREHWTLRLQAGPGLISSDSLRDEVWSNACFKWFQRFSRDAKPEIRPDPITGIP